MDQSVINIIEGSLGLVILEEWSILLKEMHITMCFPSKVTNKTTKKVYLPLQTLELKEVGWGSQGEYSSNLQWINLDAIFRNHVA